MQRRLFGKSHVLIAAIVSIVMVLSVFGTSTVAASPLALVSVAVNPPIAVLAVSGTQEFTAIPTCSGFGGCPAGMTYAWTLTSGLGALNVTTGSVVLFTAGATTGNMAIFVNVTSGATTVQSAPVYITISSTAPNPLTSVAISPTSAWVIQKAVQNFTAIPSCTGGPCSGISYAWAITGRPAIGTLNVTIGTGTVVGFTASSTRTGDAMLYLNATQDSTVVSSTPVPITVSGPLSSVSVTPPTSSVVQSTTQMFTAIPTCTNGCIPGTTFAWNLNNSLGTLTTSPVGSVTNFTAGTTPGNVELFVNATLNGVTKMSTAVDISIILTPLNPLASVAVAPTSATVNTGKWMDFTATPACTGGPCSGISYAWALTGPTGGTAVGTLNASITTVVNFTASATRTGDVMLYLNATQNSIVVASTPVPIIVASPLTSVTVAPTSALVVISATQMFTATPVCAGGCMPGTTFAWNLNNSLGTLTTSPVGSVTNFTAGTSAGVVSLFVNATLNGVTKMSTATHISIVLVAPNPLASVTVSPVSASVPNGGSAVFTATPTCTGGPCSGITYAWALTRTTLGTLNASTSTVVNFTAGGFRTGLVTLYLNASLNGASVEGNPVPITVVPTLRAVEVTPMSALNVSGGGIQNFTATPLCTGGRAGTCPTGTTYVWSLTSALLGNVNSSAGSPENATFNAYYTPGNVTLYLNATLNGVTVEAMPIPITVNASSLPVLNSVAVTPASPSMMIGNSLEFTASPTCVPGPCPPGTDISYAWNLASGIATFVATSTTAFVNVSAIGPAGAVTLFVNATYNGLTVGSTDLITVTSSSETTITSVSVAPSGPTVQVNKTQGFTATPVCSTSSRIGDTCPATGLSYQWSLNNGLGSLSASTSTSVTFTAGSKAGVVALFVNATLNDQTVQSMADFITITTTPVLPLAGVTVSPTSASLSINGTVQLIAAPVCTGGTCQPGTTFAWTLSNHLGSLSPTSGSTVTFTAGTTAGSVNVFVNATLNGNTVMSSAVPIVISAASVLSSVSVSPSSESIKVGGTVQFTATPVCTATCPAGIVYSWSLTNTLGAISSNPGAFVNFTAGQKAGTVVLFVNATLNGVKETAQVTISITSSSSSNVLGLSTTSWYIVIAVIVVVVALALIVLIMRRKGGSSKKSDAWWHHEEGDAAAGTGGAAAAATTEETGDKDEDAPSADEKADSTPTHEEEVKDADTTSTESPTPTEGDSPKEA
jgi:hypothetical protein